MSHKVNPKGYRLGINSTWDSRWFTVNNFKDNLKEDLAVRRFLERKLSKVGVERIEIERFPGRLKIIISSSRPGLIIGREGKGVEILKNELLSKVLRLKKAQDKKARNVQLVVKEVKNPWLEASFVGQWIARQIEGRVPFRRVLKQALNRIKLLNKAQGARIEVSGRLNGVTIARKEWLSFGKMPRQTIRADIDFFETKAHCTYGVIGIKVWIYKGEKFNKDYALTKESQI